MKWISVVLIAALLVQTGYVPCAARGHMILKGDEIDRTRFTVGSFVEITYRTEKGRRSTSKGYVKAVGDHAFTIGRGLWKQEVEYRNIISLKLDGDVPAQDAFNAIENRDLWINAGAGRGSVGPGGGFSITHQAETHLISLRGAMQVKLTSTGFFSHRKDPVWDIGMLYGRAFRGQKGLASLSVGLGIAGGRRIVSHTRVSQGYTMFGSAYRHDITTRTFRTVGIPIEAQLHRILTSSPALGLGLYGFANLNSERSFAGILLCLQSGM